MMPGPADPHEVELFFAARTAGLPGGITVLHGPLVLLDRLGLVDLATSR